MTPKLYDNSLELIGFLKDIISCAVTEKRNGMYECEFIYPLAGELYDELKEDCYILTKSNDNDPLQFFRIYSKSPEIRGKTTYKAEHISYLLNSNPIESVKVENSSASTAINAIKDAAKISQGFTFTSDVNGLGSIDLQALSVKQALGGVEGSLLDVFGGEYFYDNKSVKLCAARGNDNGVRISYGKNMADFTQDLSIESTYTHVFPYFKTDNGIVTLVSTENPSGLISLSNPNNYTHRALILELNVEGEEQPTKATLQTKANAYISQNSLNAPSLSIKVSMVNLSDSPEFAEYAELERCSLCDTVTVIHQPLKIKTKAKIIETVYDSIAERYISMTIGESTSTLSDSFQKTNNEIKKIANLYQKNTNTIQTMINNAVDAATKAITGNSGGYIRLYPETNPQELCIMDTNSIITARKIWRFNLSGFGFSSTGYNGTYRTAITMDGAINADFITTGTLTANIIRAGILSSATGNTYFNLDNGLLHTNNAEIVGGKVTIGGNAFKTEIYDGWLKQYNYSETAEVGGIIPYYDEDTDLHFQTIYSSNNPKSKGVLINYQGSDGYFNKIAQFNTEFILFYKKATFYYDIVTNETAGNIFAAVTHYRTTDFGGKNTSPYTAIATFGCGVAHSKPSAALQLQNYSSSTITARLDVYASEGEAMICLRGSSGSSTSNELELGKNIWFGGEMNAKKFNVSSTEEIKENIRDVDTALDVLKTASVYKYNLIPDETVIEDVDESAMELHTCPGGIENIVISEDGDDSDDFSTDSYEPEPESVEKDSIGFVIGDDTPDILLSEDKKHIDLYTVVALNWKATQEILSRLETLEGGKT